MSLPMTDAQAMRATIQVLEGVVGSLKQLQSLNVKPREEAEAFIEKNYINDGDLPDLLDFIYGKPSELERLMDADEMPNPKYHEYRQLDDGTWDWVEIRGG